jgi:cellulose synthase/poly-beta-1,6-N-acetylglucosamine synthase-like glycosyltransferase
MMVVVLASLAVLAYIYGGYYLLLRLAARRAPPPVAAAAAPLPALTVLITVRNEQAEIRARVQNVLDCEYEGARLEVLIASDGSTDATDSLVLEFTDPRVRLLRLEGSGKSAAQNRALATARGEIIVFTDAATRFAPGFLREIAAPFDSREVGGVDGHLLFVADAAAPLAQAQSYYWRQELRLRELESALGMLAVASGACLAARASALKALPATVGEDCVVPLDIVRAGLRMVHASRALAYDRLESGSHGEFRARVRMTLRNWQGTWLYPDLLNPLRHPRLAWTLWSHKLLRWLSPFFVLTWLSASLALAVSGSALRAAAAPAGVFVIMVLILIAVPPARNARGWRIAWSFLVANAGFALGVVQALAGRRIVTYRH